MNISNKDSMPTVLSLISNTHTLTAAQPDKLLMDQQQAFDIVSQHLWKSLHNEDPPQLLMQVHGKGGTGKSKLIQTITAHFTNLGVEDWLVKFAYTSIAASLIGGETTHQVGRSSVNGRHMGSATKSRLEGFWKKPWYLIIDEVSMISQKCFANLSRNIAAAKISNTVCNHL